MRNSDILQVLQEAEKKDPEHFLIFQIVELLMNIKMLVSRNVQSLWRPEYASYMIEGTPGKPYGGLLGHLNVVETNMKYRCCEVTALLKPDERIFSITSFPRLGSPNSHSHLDLSLRR